MNSGDAVTAAFAALTARAWTSNRARAAELTGLVDEWRATGRLSAERRERVRAVAHSLRGSAGTFGHEDVADAAEALEGLVSTEQTPRLDLVAEAVARIHAGLSEPPVAQLFSEDSDREALPG